MSLNRAQKIKKLANAIKDYKGKYHPISRAWIVRPKPAAKVRVKNWLQELGLDSEIGMEKVDSLKSFQEFHAWLLELRNAEIGGSRNEDSPNRFVKPKGE